MTARCTGKMTYAKQNGQEQRPEDRAQFAEEEEAADEDDHPPGRVGQGRGLGGDVLVGGWWAMSREC